MYNIKSILIEENYPSHIIEKTIEKLKNLTPQVNEAFHLWITNHIEPQIIIEGYSYKTLVENYGMKPIGAFLTLDWLIREPQKALTSLKKGIK